MTHHRSHVALCLLAALCVAGPRSAIGADPVAPAQRAPMTLDLGKSQVVRLGRPARDVLVASPGIADVVLRSPDTAFVVGRKVGETNVFFLDAEGRQIDGIDVNVVFDSEAVKTALKHALPTEQIDITSANQSLVLSGAVASQTDLENAQQIVRQFVPDDKSIVNLLTVHDKNQVLLRVRVTEMERNTVKELGITPGYPSPININLNGVSVSFAGNPTLFPSTTPAYGGFAVTPTSIPGSPYGLGASPAVTPFGPLAAAGAGAASAAPSGSFSALLQALEQNGMVKTLAEPNLTAVSGETASFLVGGKFPLPSVVPVGTTAQVVPEYYPFGVQLTFTPIVLSSGLISLRIATTVSSETSTTTIGGSPVPNLSERSATTTVELPSGGSVAIAGLLQDSLDNTIAGLPGIMNIPILGALFSSKQFTRGETDLVIAVTAFLIKPVDPNTIAFPADGFGPSSDFNMYLLGKLNATYTKPTPEAPRQPNGPFGFILE
jgi:pilus assembly protein CpaC